MGTSSIVSYDYHFKDAIKKAKLTGKLIGISLALGYPFCTQNISMIGFSLGTQVIKSCLRTLHQLKAYDIINNVTFFAGASHYEQHTDEWEKIFNSVVGGEIKNMYSTGDRILQIYSSTCKVNKPIGRNEIWNDRKSNQEVTQDEDAKAIREIAFSLKNIENHDRLWHK